MINIEDKRLCTGCGACVSACFKGAIRLEEDEEGFLYPVVNEKECVHCGKCDSVCHMNKSVQLHNKNQEEYYAAYAKQESILKSVSSGGAAWVLTEYFIRNGGVVYGAVQKDIDVIQHERAETIATAEGFKKSKYLQSLIGECYKNAKDDLLNNKTVLFTGTPCQIAGLYGYLGKDYNNLFTIDIVCHGVPSVLAFRNYKEEMEKKYKSKMKKIIFRDKTYGWNNNQYCIQYENGLIIRESSGVHLFHGAYLQGLFYRPSCGECKYAALPRIADFTLADFWKYQGKLKESNNNCGISLILCNTEKASKLIPELSKSLNIERVTEKMAIDSCRHLTKCPVENSNREKFFKCMKKSGYTVAAKKYIPKRMLVLSAVRKLRSRLYEK